MIKKEMCLMTYAKAFIIALVIFLILDAIWVSFIAQDMYKSHLGFLMTESVRWTAAVCFYLLFTIGLVVFAILPAIRKQNFFAALGYGALLGIVCYGTYDLTNYATILGWPLKIVIYDLAWGGFVSSITSGITYGLLQLWKAK